MQMKKNLIVPLAFFLLLTSCSVYDFRGDHPILEALCIAFPLEIIGQFFSYLCNFKGIEEDKRNIYNKSGDVIGSIGTGEYHSSGYGSSEFSQSMHTLTSLVTFVISVSVAIGEGTQEDVFSYIAVAAFFFWAGYMIFVNIFEFVPWGHFLSSSSFKVIRRIWQGVVLLGFIIG